MYRRHFDETDLLISKVTHCFSFIPIEVQHFLSLQISRESIDILKSYFRDQMQPSDWKLVLELKKVFQIV